MNLIFSASVFASITLFILHAYFCIIFFPAKFHLQAFVFLNKLPNAPLPAQKVNGPSLKTGNNADTLNLTSEQFLNDCNIKFHRESKVVKVSYCLYRPHPACRASFISVTDVIPSLCFIFC